MKHFTTTHFWKAYDALPAEVRKLADKDFELVKDDPDHPSLHLKKVGRFRSVRVGRSYRALAAEHDDGLLWFWIGTHAEYDDLIS